MSRPPLLPGAARPLLFAHRGLAASAPENSLEAFSLARRAGVPGLELDVHLSADGRLAVIHDHDTARVLGQPAGTGLEVEASPWPALAGLELSPPPGASARGSRIPLLEEVFEEIGPGAYFDIELKNRRAADYGLEKAVAIAVARADGGRGLAERCIVSSYNPFALRRFRALAPAVPIAVIWDGSPLVPAWLRHGEGRWLGRVDLLKPHRAKVRFSSAFRWRNLGGWRFIPWPVDDPEEARRFFELGAEGFISNRPEALGIV